MRAAAENLSSSFEAHGCAACSFIPLFFPQQIMRSRISRPRSNSSGATANRAFFFLSLQRFLFPGPQISSPRSGDPQRRVFVISHASRYEMPSCSISAGHLVLLGASHIRESRDARFRGTQRIVNYSFNIADEGRSRTRAERRRETRPAELFTSN